MKEKTPSIFASVKPYKTLVLVLLMLTFAGNALSLIIPKLISRGIDTYMVGTLDMQTLGIQFVVVSFGIFLFTYLQGVFQTYAGERVARDMRANLVLKISEFSFARLMQETESKLLTNLTSDIDAVKSFISQAVVIIISSVVRIL